MTNPDTIKALRDALTECRNYLSDFYANAKVRGAEAAHKNAFKMQQVADEALALTADASEDAPDFQAAIDAAYPHTGSPHASVQQRVKDARIAFCKGWDACLAARPAPVAATPAPAELTDEDIDTIWQSMPGGPAGWLKSFGYNQFAREIEAAIMDGAAAPAAPIAEVTAPKLIAWCEEDCGTWHVHGAETSVGQHITMYQKDSHYVSVFPLFDGPVGQQAGAADGEIDEKGPK